MARGATLVHDQEALSTTAEEVIARNSNNRRAIIRNIDEAITVYIGSSDAVTSSNGFPLKADEVITLELMGAVWMIAASGTPSVAYIIERD